MILFFYLNEKELLEKAAYDLQAAFIVI